jgi:anthranilate synthase component 1
MTSDVVGELSPGRSLDELIRASFPAGTMAGAPKVRAMQIIDELESTPRGLYAGAVGSFGAEHASLFLTIRSMVLRDGRVTVRAGGGIVHDSDPDEEYREILAKLGAAARVIGLELGEAR